jgi:hypothetical protein
MRIDDVRGSSLQNHRNLTAAPTISSSSKAHKAYSRLTSSPPVPSISHQDDQRETRRFLSQAKPSKITSKPSPSISHQDDQRETRRFLNQAKTSKITTKPSPPVPSISHQDDQRETRRFLNQAKSSKITSKPSPSISHQDDQRETRRFLNQAKTSKITTKPSPPVPSISHQDDQRETRRFLSQSNSQAEINYIERKDLDNSGLSKLQAPKSDGAEQPENSWLSEWGHGALDAIGVVDPFGIADGANAVWYLADGDNVNAAISAAGMIPFVGDVAKVGKYGVKGYRALRSAEEAADAASSIKGASRQLRGPDGRFISDPKKPRVDSLKHRSPEYQRARAELKNRSIDDPNTNSEIRGWLSQERYHRGNNPRKWRNPPGYDTGHPIWDTDSNKLVLRWETRHQNRSRGARYGK